LIVRVNCRRVHSPLGITCSGATCIEMTFSGLACFRTTRFATAHADVASENPRVRARGSVACALKTRRAGVS
jgi:hypothetical protein